MTDILALTENLLHITTIICFVGIAVSILLLLYRIVIGPTNPDRAVALDSLGINLMAVAAIMSIVLVTTKLNDVILLIGIVLFIGTIAIAKFIEKGDIIDRDME